MDDFEDYERDEYDSELKNVVDYINKIAKLTNKASSEILDSI